MFLIELGTCVQNLMFTKVVKGWQKNYFPPRGMLKFTFKGHFLTIKIAYEKFLELKSKQWKHALVLLYTYKYLFLRNTEISIFGGISKFHFLVDLADFAA